MKNEDSSARNSDGEKALSTEAQESKDSGHDVQEAKDSKTSIDTEQPRETPEKVPWRITAEPADQSINRDDVELDDDYQEDEEQDEEDAYEEQNDDETVSIATSFDDNDDPLGDAYDLECGDVLKPTEVEIRHAHWKGKISTPREFFGTEVLYRHDILEDADRELIRGSYRIELKGAQGGIWTLTLGDQIEVVNRVEDADVVISMQQKDFLDLVNGILNPQLAILAKKIKIQGDIKRAIFFQSILAPNGD